MCEGEVSDLFPVYSFNQLWNKRQETGMELFKLWMPEDELYEQNYLGEKKGKMFKLQKNNFNLRKM